jgi:hydrogenase-4 component F
VLLLVAIPLACAAVAVATPSPRGRPWILVAGAAGHAAAVARVWAAPPAPALGGWVSLDAAGLLVLALTSALNLFCAIYAVGYLARRPDRDNRTFVAGLLVLLAATSAVAMAQHLGLLWVTIEVTTLATAPLIYFNRSQPALEATWKYLVVCSVGIAFALLGTFLLALASAAPGGPRSLLLADLVASGPALPGAWVRFAFVFLLAGYGTKMGLAPFHGWKPDAYGEAPGLLGAILSGAVTSVAFLSLVRGLQVCDAAGEGAFARSAFVAVGLLSIALAAVFLVRQRDFKRMLAYSSVEHMGILALGVGVGGASATGAFLHLVNNGLTKGVLFLAAGNIHRAFGTKQVDGVRGAALVLPVSGPVFLASFLAITGSPPFAPFFSEFAVLNGAIERGAWVAAAVFLVGLAVIFVGMGATVLGIVQGAPPAHLARPESPPQPRSAGPWQSGDEGDSLLTAGPPLVLLALVLVLGVWTPGPLGGLIQRAAALAGGR